MAKDPAFLFYPNDWMGGTMTMTRHHKGCYIDLLVAQFNSGPLSLEEIKNLLGQDQAAWTVLSRKFSVDSTGKYFNERLETEKAKRVEYSNKQKERIAKRWNKDGIQLGNTAVLPKIENENEIVNKDFIKNKKANKIPEEIIYPFHSEGFMQAWDKWLRFKKEQFNFTYKFIGLQGCLDDIKKLSGGDELTAIELINNAISKGYKGIYPINNYSKSEVKKESKTDQTLSNYEQAKRMLDESNRAA
jgi:hypothetical protein